MSAPAPTIRRHHARTAPQEPGEEGDGQTAIITYSSEPHFLSVAQMHRDSFLLSRFDLSNKSSGILPPNE